MKDTAHPGSPAEQAADRPATDDAQDADHPTASVDAEKRIGEMAAELDHLATSIDDAKRAAAADPYLDPPTVVPDVTEGEDRSP